MDIFADIFRFFITFFIFKTILSLFLNTKIVRKENLVNADTSTDASEENIQHVVVDMVYDDICGAYIDKSKAYQILEDDKTHYFCSWECRSKYIDLN